MCGVKKGCSREAISDTLMIVVVIRSPCLGPLFLNSSHPAIQVIKLALANVTDSIIDYLSQPIGNPNRPILHLASDCGTSMIDSAGGFKFVLHLLLVLYCALSFNQLWKDTSR